MADKEKKYRIVGNGWKKETKDGKIFLSLNFKEAIPAETAAFMFPNDYKRKGKDDPDWVINIKNE